MPSCFTQDQKNYLQTWLAQYRVSQAGGKTTEFWSDFFAAWFEAYPEPSDGDNDLLMFLNKEKKK
jgi:hypothetical protein